MKTGRLEGERGLQMRAQTLQDPLKSDWKCQNSLDGRQSRARGEKWLADSVSWPVRSGDIIPWPYCFSLAPWCAVKPCLPARCAQQRPELGWGGTLAPAWHQDSAEIGQVERHKRRDGGQHPAPERWRMNRGRRCGRDAHSTKGAAEIKNRNLPIAACTYVLTFMNA